MDLTKINSYMESMKYVYMLVAYILCIVYMYYDNTEYICFILFIVLHIFLLFIFFSSGAGKSIGQMVTVLPFNFVVWDGKVPLSFIFLVGWALLLVANSILINTYRVLHAAFGTVGKPVDLGDPKNYILKKYLKITMIISTIFLWMLFTFNFINKLPRNIINGNQTRFDKIINQIKDKSLIIISINTIFFASLSIYLSQQLASKTKTITTPHN